ncbi:AraC family transcriptional regulator ligand-binding domain-containing protein [bacterium SCSIO 12741]|nr:AraC family transcriptional regulator ligand-binding domain-containing protein [bacterium SCSIO 12741]
MAFNARFIRNIILVAADQGASVPLLVEPIGMTLSEMNQPDQPVEFEAYNQMMERALEQTNNPQFGISVSRGLHLSTAGLVLQLMQSSSSIREALEQVCAFYQLGCSSLPMKLEGNVLKISCDKLWRNHSERAYQQTLEGAILFLLKAFDTLTHQQQRPKRITLDYPLANREALERSFQCSVATGGEVNLDFQPGSLDQVIETADQEMLQNLVAFAERKLAKMNPTKSWTDRVNRLLLQHLPESLNQDQVASMLALSPRGLQRHLKEEGAQFRRLSENNKMEFARIHLKTKAGSVKELSYVLGYSETSAFSRAFKRHFQESPAQFIQAND